MSLLRRVVLVVMVALLPALGAEIYNQQALRATERAELDDEAVRVAQALAAELGRILDGTRNTLVALSGMPAIETEDGAACSHLLRDVRARFTAINVLALIDSRDRVVCSSLVPEPPTVSAAHWVGVSLARERGEYAVVGYLLGHWTHVGELATAMPVRQPDATQSGGAPASVLVADIGLAWLSGQMRALAAKSETSITISDRNGLVLVNVPGGGPAGSTLAAAERGLLADPQARVTHDTAPEGRQRTVAIARLPDLSIFVARDRSQAGAAQERAAERSYLMFGAGLLIALAGAFLLARQTVAVPVARILHTIARWRAGDASARVDGQDTQSELGRIGGALDDLLGAFERTAGELREGQLKLQDRVAERTRQLEAEIREREQAQRRLQQAQKMEVIGQLAGGVAHDFNNLLAVITGNIELARRRGDEHSDVVRLLDSAMRAADRGAALTQRMLAFGRRQFLQLQPVDVGALLDGMKDMLKRSIGPMVGLQVQAQPALWWAKADPGQLELVLLNLANNARDAMPQGGALLITAANEQVRSDSSHPARLAGGDYVRLSIKDTGAGIEPAALEHVLEPFFTTKPAGKGSGLGLSMAQGVAAQSGGGLSIESEVGQGTTVTVWLPKAAPQNQQQSAMLGAAAVDPPPLSSRGACILVVEDDPDVAEVARQCLEEAGYAVLHATEGASALAMLDAHASIDLMLTDFAMPGMNGVQLARIARARHPALCVLLATGYADMGTIDGAAPGFPLLDKPFKVAQLLHAVAKLLEPPQLQPPAAGD